MKIVLKRGREIPVPGLDRWERNASTVIIQTCKDFKGPETIDKKCATPEIDNSIVKRHLCNIPIGKHVDKCSPEPCDYRPGERRFPDTKCNPLKGKIVFLENGHRKKEKDKGCCE